MRLRLRLLRVVGCLLSFVCHPVWPSADAPIAAFPAPHLLHHPFACPPASVTASVSPGTEAAAAWEALRGEAGLMVQVVVPKTGSTALKYSLAPAWKALFGGPNVSAVPFLAGDCEAPHNDHHERCVSQRTFPCVGMPVRRGLGGAGAVPQRDVGYRCTFHPPSQHLSWAELRRGFLPERGIDLGALRPTIIVVVLREPVARVASEFHQCVPSVHPTKRALIVQVPVCSHRARLSQVAARLVLRLVLLAGTGRDEG